MTVVLLDPRFPSMIPVEAVTMLSGEVSYTEEVPIRIRWVIGDLGGKTVYESDVLVTTDLRNDEVIARVEEGEELIAAPSLLVHLNPNGHGPQDSGSLESSPAPALPSAEAISQANAGAGEYPEQERAASYENYAHAVDDAYRESAALYQPQQQEDQTTEDSHAADEAASAAYSGHGFVEGEVLSADEHSAAVAGSRRTARTEVPESVMDEIEDAVALMARSLRQGEWERSKSHADLLPYLWEETEELATAVQLREQLAATANTEGGHAEDSDGEAEVPEWAEQDLCEELSDVLLQVFFHAEIANRRGAFDIGHVAGAFVAKMRQRAPYLFEDVERAVSKSEQEQLWQRGKQLAERDKKQTYGPAYEEYLQRKAQHVHNKEQKVEATVTPLPQPAPESATVPAAQPTHTSALSAADEVIREARARGLRDTDIPTDIRYPMVGLELDEPGGAEDRLLKAVQNFRQQLSRKDS